MLGYARPIVDTLADCAESVLAGAPRALAAGAFVPDPVSRRTTVMSCAGNWPERLFRGKAMRGSLVWKGLFMLLAGTQAASAHEFCDVKSFSGGGMVCPQSRPSLPPQTSGGGIRPNALPNYSDLDLKIYDPGQFTQLRFDLDFRALDLLPPPENARSDYNQIDVMQFGVRSDTFLPDDPGTYRVLVLSMVRVFGSDAYTLEFSWRDPSAVAPDGSNPLGEINSAVVQLGPVEKRFTVQIEPLLGDGDWSNLNVAVWASSSDLGTPFNGGDEPDVTRHAVDLVYDKPEGFVMPDRPLTLSLVRPWNLRSGIIRGDLRRAGMTTNFVYYLPPDNPSVDPFDGPAYD